MTQYMDRNINKGKQIQEDCSLLKYAFWNLAFVLMEWIQTSIWTARTLD